jgi:hypothetical protein
MRIRGGKNIAWIFLVGGWLLSMPVQRVKAFEPVPDLWYVETVTLDEAGLPPNFHVYSGESSPEQLAEGVWLSTNNPNTSLQAMIYLINRSDEPVFVLSLEHRERLIMETPDEFYEARVRGAHEVASYLVRPGSGEMFALNWEALKDLDHGLKEVNPPTFEARPAGVTPPEEQHSELLMVYGEQVVLLPFTISYAINENFKIEEYLGPAGVAEPTMLAAADRELGDQGTIIVVLAGLGAAALIAWRVWRGQRRD